MGKEKNTLRLLLCEGQQRRAEVSFPKDAGSISATERRLNPAAIVGHFELATKPQRGPSLLSKTLGTFQCANCGRWGKGGDFTNYRGFLCVTCLRVRGKGGE